jgi:hypothetical protein
VLFGRAGPNIDGMGETHRPLQSRRRHIAFRHDKRSSGSLGPVARAFWLAIGGASGALRAPEIIRTLSGMNNNDSRFEVWLPSQRRRELDELAGEAGLSSSDLVRLAISRLLTEREVVLRFSQRGEA